MKAIKPIFIFSMPRSGSTLLQRILMSHSKISSIAEPQMLLPFVYASKKEGVLSEYQHYTSSKGIRNIIDNLPNKEKDYNKFLRNFSVSIYHSLSDSRSFYFIDKTPHYYRIINDIHKIFPNAKFIFLFRNPVQVYASTLITFCNNRFSRKFYGNYNHIYKGFELLSIGYNNLKRDSFGINYEKILSSPKESITEILDYLDLKFEPQMLSKFPHQNLKGNLGDKLGIENYDQISKEPLQKWKQVFSTVFRRSLLLKYINGIDENYFQIQNYSKSKIIEEISGLEVRCYSGNIKDFIDFHFGKFVIKNNLNVIFSKRLRWTRNQYLT